MSLVPGNWGWWTPRGGCLSSSVPHSSPHPGYLRTPPATLRAAPSRRLSRSPGPNPVRVRDYTPLPTERGVVYGRPRRAEDHWVPYAEHYWRKAPPPRVSPRHIDRLRMQGRPSSPGPHHPLLYFLSVLI